MDPNRPPQSPVFQFDVSAQSPRPADPRSTVGPLPPADALLFVLRQMTHQTERLAAAQEQLLAVQQKQLRVLEELAQHMINPHKQRAGEIEQWKKNHPELASNCRVAAETLHQVQVDFLERITTEVNDNPDCLRDSEFMLQEFVDRFGPRLVHLGGVLQVLAQLSGPPAVQE